jgi:GWxTD domain-containing protein
MNRRRATIPWLTLCLWLLSLAAPAPAAKLDPASEDFYNMTRHFMTRDEEKAFRNLLTPELRREFIEAFWEIRDPDPDTGENEFRVELEERFEFVNRYLREANRPGWDTARGRVYLVLGPPNTLNAAETPAPLSSKNSALMSDSVIWPYRELGLIVWFVDRQGYGVFELDMINTSPRLIQYLKEGRTRFIRNKGEDAENRFLEFKARIEPASDTLFVSIAIKDLRFDIEEDGKYASRIHLAINLYQLDGTILSRKDNRRIVFDPGAQKKERLTIEWTIPLQKGKNRADLLVRDLVGGKSNRHVLSVTKR